MWKPNDKAKSNDEEAKTNFNEKKAVCEMQNFYIFFVFLFLLITMALSIAVSIYCYLIKYRAKEK